MTISPSGVLIGLAIALALPLCALASLAPEWTWLCWMILLLLGGLAAFDAFLGHRSLQTLETHGPAAVKWMKNRPAELEIRLAHGHTHELELAPEWPTGLDAQTVRLPAMATTAIFACTPGHRGRYVLSKLHIRRMSPFHLWRVAAVKAMHIEIRVYPDLAREPGMRLLMMKKQGGLRTLRTVGKGRDFERLREYAPGDSYDEIAWKASARRGRPIVRVFQVERTQDVYAIVDSSRLSARGEAADQFVNAALMLALAAENNGDNFGLATFNGAVEQFVAPGRGQLHFARCRDTLFDLQPAAASPDFAELISFLQLRVRRRSLLLFLTDLADPLAAETFLAHVHLLARRHVVLINRLRDDEVRPLFHGVLPRTHTEIAARLAGHLQWNTLEEVQQALRTKGVHTAELKPDSAGLDLVRQYFDVKRRQAL